MGEVYRSHDHRVGRDVAIKVLPHRLAADDEARSRFQREAKAIAAISHPNILALYEFEREGDIAYVVTELLEGETLRGLIRRGPVSWRRAAEIGASIADGLAAAHGKGIVHRDLKPENVFITTEGHVKILDFGLAKAMTDPVIANAETERLPHEALVATERMSGEAGTVSTVAGSVGYMSPEQLRGQSATPASDLFALGCILYEMVIGRSAFIAESPVETMSAVLRDDVPDLTQSGKRIPFELDRIIRRCLEKHPDARFQSARDLAFAIRAIGTSPVERDDMPRPRRPRRALLALAIVIAATLALLLGAYLMKSSGEESPVIHSLAVLPFVNATKDPNNEYLSDGITESLINTLSQIPELSVVSRTSVFRYKGKDAPPQTVAHELSVQALLTGRIVQPGAPKNTDLIISAELIDGSNNRHLWGEQYQAKMSDLATVQATISSQIAEQLRLQLSGHTRKTVEKRPTENSEAYRLYLQGRYELNKRTGDSFERAIRNFSAAIQRDPNYALAYAGLADCYILQSIYNESPPSKALPLAAAAADRAIALDDELAEAHTSRAYYLMNFDSDLTAAAREFDRAIVLNPSYATAHQWYSRLLITTTRYNDAIREIRRAEMLDPLSLVIIAETGGVYADSGRLDDAVAECRRAIDLEPSFAFAHYVLAGALLKQRKLDDAIRESEAAWRLGEDPRSLVRLGLAYRAAGRDADADRVLTELQALRQKRFVPSYGVATLEIALGRTDDALAHLKQASQEIPPGQYHRLLEQDPLLDPIRAEAGFKGLR
ncbi:MAG: eukaryotic-like serine/threonine-protein kinase [Thermoanaerobaculia bacterium]|jgi:serine/threonine-protein kinase|nr:eukaryotic-like serine/threonine-protein kinase [Thermoanaerobaculia bacterium]